MRIGGIDIQAIRDGSTWEPADSMLTRPGVSDPWSCHPEVVDEHGRIVMEVGGFLIRTADRKILVDAGLGTIQKGRHQGGAFLRSLAETGTAVEDVTDVVFSHLHYDHVGWSTQKGRVVFPNATYRVHEDDWNHFVESDQALEGAVRKLSPLREQLELFSADTTLAPGLDTRHTPGHTPGSTVYIVSDQGRRALLLGDAVHTVAELAEPDWHSLIDQNPAQASENRNAIADEVCDTADLVTAAHFPDFGFGRVVTTEQGRRFHFLS